MTVLNFSGTPFPYLLFYVSISSLGASELNAPRDYIGVNGSPFSATSEFSFISVPSPVKREAKKEEVRWDSSYFPPRLEKGMSLKKAGENYIELRNQYFLLRTSFLKQQQLDGILEFSFISVPSSVKREAKKEKARWNSSYFPPRLEKGMSLKKAGENYIELRNQYFLLKNLFRAQVDSFVLVTPPLSAAAE